VSDDGKFRVVSEGNNQLVDHKSEDSHLGGTSVVEFDGSLGKLGLFIKRVPSEVNVSVAEVTNELVSCSWDILHEGALKDSNKGDDLHKSSGGDGIGSDDGGDTVGVRGEGVTRVVNVSRKVDSGAGDDLSEEGKLTDASVLDLDVTKAVEAFLVFTRKLSEGIEESKRGLGTEFALEGHGEGAGLDGLLRGGESGGGGNKGGDDGGLHDDQFI
jgi:hypothetical protein